MTAIEYPMLLTQKSNTVKIRVGFGPDEEIGVGADKFDVEDFNVDCITVDGGPLENFSTKHLALLA